MFYFSFYFFSRRTWLAFFSIKLEIINNEIFIVWTIFVDGMNHEHHRQDKTIKQINDMAKKFKYVSEGDFLINLTAMPVKSKGMVNTLRVSEI